MRQWRRRVWAATVVAAAVGCGGDGGTGTEAGSGLSGTYDLSQVDGTPVASLPAGSTTLVSGFLIFPGGDAALRVRTTRTSPAFGQPYLSTDTVAYSYRRDGSRLVLQYPGVSQLADTGTMTTSTGSNRIDVRTRILPFDGVRTVTFLQLR